MKSSTRPLSPHIQVYKMPLSAKLSIFHRLTGLVLSGGTVILVLWLFGLAYSSDLAIRTYAFFSTLLGKVFLMALTYAFVYHFLNGIRHLFWDVAKGLDLESVNKSGIIVILLSIVITALIWVLGVN